MKTIINLLVAAVLLNAVWRCGSAARNYYLFEDAAHQVVLFSGESTTAEVHEQIMSRATELRVPIPGDGLTVRRDGRRTVADVSYVQPIEVFPNYKYPVTLSFRVEAQALATGNAVVRPRSKS